MTLIANSPISIMLSEVNSQPSGYSSLRDANANENAFPAERSANGERQFGIDGNRLGAASVYDTLRERREDSDCLTVNSY
jgi:hypothetical protein